MNGYNMFHQALVRWARAKDPKKKFHGIEVQFEWFKLDPNEKAERAEKARAENAARAKAKALGRSGGRGRSKKKKKAFISIYIK